MCRIKNAARHIANVIYLVAKTIVRACEVVCLIKGRAHTEDVREGRNKEDIWA
jgi:hypothetical protein